jgi:transcriptional regulator with AAA-type ATPase domain
MKNNDEHKNLEKIYIVPPGLELKIFEFFAHLHVSGNAPILITGPTGVGKSIFIDILQKEEVEKAKEEAVTNMIIINCAHFDPGLAESELFGHVKGAFTGATKDKKGVLAAVKNGTVVLDEIGELSENVQAKLLTFIEDGFYYKVGSTKPEVSSVRIVGVTSRKENLRKDFINRFFQFSIVGR